MHHLFIVNPVAGKGQSLKILKLIEEIFKNKKNETYEFIFTEYQGHALEISKESLMTKKSRIYSIGGDGTASEIVNGIMKSSIDNLLGFGVIPCGSGNDFVRTVYKDNNYKNFKVFLEDLINGHIEIIDIGVLNESYFLNIASMGFDADVVYNGKKMKKHKLFPSGLIYLLGVIYTIKNLKTYSCEIIIDDNEKIKEDYLLIASGNGRYYGGGMKVLPYADYRDGILDICLISPVKRKKILSLLFTFMKGKHENIKEVELRKCKKISIKSSTNIPIQVDGEVMKAKEIKLKISDKKIPLITP